MTVLISVVLEERSLISTRDQTVVLQRVQRVILILLTKESVALLLPGKALFQTRDQVIVKLTLLQEN